ncbi:methylamine utilization protein [Alteromonas gilva]|uniref:Methylamine utilization protein n=1 Tax=Alteromonas gilva TaxID=2987522 RepID=A0ABT5L0I9_9ALTE|nr:methylamine utilization protein [Alteromonas gilva]MDC8830534.1 methylamine utilization protein [Alteromonas gilva]
MVPNAVKAGTVILVDSKGQPVVNAVVTMASAPVATTPDTPSRSLPPAIMDQVDKQFVPEILVIERGQTVSFPNSDNIRHHVYSFSSPKPFEIKLYSGNAVAPLLFDKSGIVVLGCNIHDSMVGYIYVSEESPSWQTNSQGQAEIGDIQGDVFIWHPDLSLNHTERLAFTVDTINNSNTTLTVERIAPPVTDKKVFGKRKFNSQ